MRTLKVSLLLAAALAALPSPLPAQGVTDTEVVLGVSSAFRGNSASLGSELFRGAMACIERVNAAGGVNGRRIRVVAYDDSYDPPQAVANTIRLVEQDRVFLLFGNVGTPTTVKVLPLVSGKYRQLPMYLFAPFTGAQDPREGANFDAAIHIRASYRQETDALVGLFTRLGKKRIGILYQNDSYGRSGYDGVKRALKARGMALAGEANYERGTLFSADLSPQVGALEEGKVDAVICVGSYQACGAFIRDLRKSGFTGPVANISFVGSEALLDLLRGQEGSDHRTYTDELYNSQVVPFFEDLSVPLVARYREDMARFSPSVPKALADPAYKPAPHSFGSLEGYLDAVVLVEALKRTGRDLTARRFKETIEKMTDLEVGLGTPVSFGPEKHQGSDKVYLVKASRGQWVPVRSGLSF